MLPTGALAINVQICVNVVGYRKMGHQTPFWFIEVDWKARALAAKPAEPKFGPWVDIMSGKRRLYTRALWHLCCVLHSPAP